MMGRQGLGRRSTSPAQRSRPFARALGLIATAAVLASLLIAVPGAAPASAAAGFSGTSEDCVVDYDALYAELISLGAEAGGVIGAGIGTIGALLTDTILDEVGWTWVDPAHPMQTLNGVVEEGSHVSYTDLPITHDSHDANFWVRPDQVDTLPPPPGLMASRDLLSDANLRDRIEAGPTHEVGPGLIEVEWETNDYPEWARPNVGDRVWTNGNWILDCGHVGENTDHHFAEIHPPRAIATTRDQVRTIPGSGTTPVPVKATDLFIHGDGGFATTMLECGVSEIILLNQIGGCPSRPGIAQDYDFDIRLDPPPTPSAVLAWSYEAGPGNTLSPEPQLTPNLDTNPPTLRVHVPLAGSGASNSDVYARKIYAGWLTPAANLHRYHAKLTQGTLFSDMDLDPGDCECTAFWMSVNRAETEWVKLDGYDDPTDISSNPLCPGDNTLGDWDDNQGCGSGRLNFHGPDYDFYLANNQDVRMQFGGYDSDCFDSRYGSPHSLEVNGLGMGLCYLDVLSDIALDGPDNDDMGDPDPFGSFNATNVVGNHAIGNGNFSMNVNVTETPLGVEDKADLALAKSCSPSAVKAPGPFNCRIELTNSGPGLPRDVKVTDTIATTVLATEYSIVSPKLSWEGVAAAPPPVPCAVSGPQITCNVGSVPLGGTKAVITYAVTSNEGGTFNNTAHVTTASTDDNAGNNTAAASVTVIPQANLGITKTADPSPVLAGGLLTYTVTSTNAGPSSATDVTVSDTLPAVTLFKSATPSAGGSCTTPAVDGTGTVTCTWAGATTRDTSRSVQIVVEVPGPQTITNPASTTSATEDQDLSNNSTALATQIICTIYGTPRNDTLVGTSGFDVICGLGGNDSIKAGAGDDRVFGGAGNDSIQGEAGNDVLHGEDGDDSVRGGDGDDRLFGEAGRDTLLGDTGDDFLNGGAGAYDVCVDQPSPLPPAGTVGCEYSST